MRALLVLTTAFFLLLLMGSTYETETYRGRGGSGGGVSLSATLSGNGETPQITVRANIGYPMKIRIAAGFTGDEMWSEANGVIGAVETVIDSTEIYKPGTTAINWTFQYDDWDVRAFDGDVVDIYVWLYDENGDAWLFTEEVTLDRPYIIKHAIVRSPNWTASVDDIMSDYITHNAEVHEYGVDIDFSWAVLDQTNWDGVDHYSAYRWEYYGSGSNYTLASPSTSTMLLVRCPLEELMDEDAYVIDARMQVYAGGSIVLAPLDSMLAILNSNEDDDLWWDSDNLGSWNDSPGATFTSWQYQVQGVDTAMDAPNAATLTTWGAPATSAGAWDLASRTRYFDWGNVFQFTSEPDVTAGFNGTLDVRFTDGDAYGWRIGKLVQAAHEGVTNNGILYTYFDASGAATGSKTSVQQPGTIAANEFPYFTVSWIEGKPYEQFYPDGPDGTEATIIAVFNTDDHLLESNNNWTDVFSAHGLSYTAFLEGDEMGVTHKANMNQALTWRSKGMEIAQHGQRGFNQIRYDTLGVQAAFDGYTSAPSECVISDTTSFETQMHDLDSCWIYESAGLGYETDTLVGKTASVNLGNTTAATLLAYKLVGSLGGRLTGTQHMEVDHGDFTTGGWFTRGKPILTSLDAPGVSETDTIFTLANPHDLLAPFNAYAWSNSTSSASMVGGVGVSLSDAVIEQRILSRLSPIMGRNFGAYIWYSHSEKTDQPYSDSNNIDADELDSVLTVLQSYNVCIANAYEYLTWRWDKLVPAATPSTWGNYAAWKSSKDTGTWARMKWLPAASQQGIKRRIGS